MILNNRLSFSLCLFTFPFAVYTIMIPDLSSYYDMKQLYENVSVCDKVLEEFSDSSSAFIGCTIKNSHPIHACKQCVDSYTRVVAAHNDILTTEVNGTKCRDNLINLDRLQIIETIHTNIMSLWDRGYCTKCFHWTAGHPILSNETIQFEEYFKNAYECIHNRSQNTNDTNQICKDCMTKYLTLNSYYESLKSASETTGICMDIVDTMNATRSIWSGVLNCCKLRKTPELIFLICTGAITALPVIFYLLAKIYCDNVTKLKVFGQNRLTESECPAGTSLSEDYN